MPSACLPVCLVAIRSKHLFLNSLDVEAHPYFSLIRDLRVSAHFFIRRDGELVQFVSCAQRAWHAGVSRWNGRERLQ